jgi:hypothetical protein
LQIQTSTIEQLQAVLVLGQTFERIDGVLHKGAGCTGELDWTAQSFCLLCLAEAGVEPSVGSKGDSDDNALAETIGAAQSLAHA